MSKFVGSRDDIPEPNIYVGRAKRARANLLENMQTFLTLGVLALIVEGTDMAMAIFGAQLFVFGRIAHTILYLISFP